MNMTRQASKVELLYSVILLIVGIVLLIMGNFWGMPILWGVLTLQNYKNYRFYRNSGDKKLHSVARNHQRTAIVLGTCTVVMIGVLLLF